MELISQLPEPYKELALKRQQECAYDIFLKTTDNLATAFIWDGTPEGEEWWESVFDAKTEAELPPLPQTEMTDQSRIVKELSKKVVEMEKQRDELLAALQEIEDLIFKIGITANNKFIYNIATDAISKIKGGTI